MKSKTTGKEAASNAGKVLSDPTSTKAEKSTAASALSQVAKPAKKASKKKPSKKRK